MMMWIFADILLIALVAFMGSRAMKKGFLKSSYAGVSSLVTIVLVFALHTPFQGYVENSFIGDTVKEEVRLAVENSLNENGISQRNATDDAAEKAVDGLKLPEFMEGLVKNTIESQKQNYNSIKEDLTEGLTNAIFPVVMQILSVLLLYLLIRIGIWLIFTALKLIFEIPVLGTADKILGAAIGGVNALLIIYAVSALLMLFTPTASAEAVEAGINSTYLYKYFYYNNIIVTLLFG